MKPRQALGLGVALGIVLCAVLYLAIGPSARRRR
jgi:hypothetical protein